MAFESGTIQQRTFTMRYPSGIDRGEARLRVFETRYGMTSAEFLQRYENDELPETLELDEWIGEIKMLQRLQGKAD
jgi:hypothetical protein